MYAIINTGGKQVKVSVGDTIFVEKLASDIESEYVFNEVLLVGGDKLTVGKPFVKGASVTAKVVKQGRQKKIIVFKYKPKKNYKRKQGHRQAYTRLEILSINV